MCSSTPARRTAKRTLVQQPTVMSHSLSQTSLEGSGSAPGGAVPQQGGEAERAAR